MTENDVQQIILAVSEMLVRKGRERGLDLVIKDQEFNASEDALFLCVPSRPTGIRVLDYAETLSEIEKELHEQGIDRVFLVPRLDYAI